jgi:hypothetical protein
MLEDLLDTLASPEAKHIFGRGEGACFHSIDI